MASVSNVELPRARSTELMSVADKSEEPPKIVGTVRSTSNYESLGSSDYVRDRPLTIEEKR